ncbi:MAG: malate/lactate/ureidoglycolate dehydrogenase [Alphaproteobacteria bacterium]|nr:malate/lactate/ureidoglycolate dehydrogenase [Alphaproteobacteria bacterium]
MPSTHVVAARRLEDFVSAIFAAAGCSRDEAAQIGHFLLSANLAGHDSHGVIRTPRYVQWLHEGKVLAGQKLTVVNEGPVTATVDGNYGFGQTIGPLAVDLGIAKARASGLAAIALRHSGHLGRIGDWGERAAAAGLVSLHFVNVESGELVAPFGGVDRRFSTNPICIGVPSDGTAPMLLLDLATSLVAEGKVLVASNGGKPVPEGSLVRPDGRFSNDPADLYGPLRPAAPRDPAMGEGALVAFGLHKGSGLAFMCEILGGVLSGGGTSGPIPGGKRARISNGMFSVYVDPAKFGGGDFIGGAREYANYVKASRPVTPGAEVLVPGEPEARTRADRLANGVPLQEETWVALGNTARTLGVAVPE